MGSQRLWQRPAIRDNRRMSDVRLVDLDVIKRYSLAIRQELAPAEEVLAALEASREHIIASLQRPGGNTTRRRRPRRA